MEASERVFFFSCENLIYYIQGDEMQCFLQLSPKVGKEN